MLLTLILCTITVFGYSQNFETNSEEFHRTSIFYEKLISDKAPQTALLKLFFNNTPKGGDLHHHYFGSIYA